MPFKNVTNTVGGTQPEIEPGTYTVEVLGIEEMEPGQYGDRMRWVLGLTDEDGEIIAWPNGEQYEWWQQTGTTLGPRSTARKYSDALLGRELRDGEDGDAILEELIGRTARALIEIGESGYPRIAAMTPIKKRKAKAAEDSQAEADVF
tara:strand:+ start:65 stop:508 length:444 start_codon:yes stop_codon:yes gene_type:complete